MELGSLLFLLLLLACPLMMVFMHRGGAGHGSHGEGHGHTHGAADEMSGTRSLDELRSTRAELDAEIALLEQAETEEMAQLEQSETETKTPALV